MRKLFGGLILVWAMLLSSHAFAQSIAVTAPQAGALWARGASQAISWVSSGDVGNVKIEFFIGQGVATTIVASIPDSGSYQWALPASLPVSASYQLRISSVGAPSVQVESGAFSVVAGAIAITAPNGGESWALGCAHDISWSSNLTGTNLRIDLYSLVNGSPVFVSTITSATENDGVYAWTVPSTLDASKSYVIRISSVVDSTVYSQSAKGFGLGAKSLTLGAPLGGEIWGMGTRHAVKWSSNLGGTAKVELNRGGASSVIAAAADGSSTTDSNIYYWTIPSDQTAATDYFITVTSNVDTAISDGSGQFSIVPSSFIKVEQPNGGETLVAGTFYEVKWASSVGGDVQIAYSADGGVTYTVVATTSNTGSYSWKTPATAGSQYRVKITSVQDATVIGVSDADFSITPAAISMVSPNGGEIWACGAAYEIQWESNVTEPVTIALYKNKGFDSWITPEGGTTANDGSYNWNIPASQLIGNDYTVVISSSTASGESAQAFTISADPFVQIVSPNGGEVWAMSNSATPLQTRKIKWSSNTNGTVRVQLCRGEGAVKQIVRSADVPNLDREYLLSLDSSVDSGYDYFAKVTLLDGADTTSVEDVSDKAFAIIAPELGWATSVGDVFAGAVQKIRWSSNIGGSFTIKLRFGGVSSTIASGVSGSGYDWQVPISTTSGSYSVSVTSDALDTISIDSGSFAITPPTFSVTSPTLNQTFGAGGSVDISWKWGVDSTISESVDMTIVLDRVDNPSSFIVANTPNTGSYTWAIPAGMAADTGYSVRIFAADNHAVTASGPPFTIGSATLSIASPNGGESWAAGSSHAVNWTSNLGGTVTISLTSDNVPNRVIAPGVANTGSYAWTIPRDLPAGIKYKLQIVSDLNSAYSSGSFDFFTITTTPYIQVLSPNGGETWAVGTSRDILWDSNAGGTVKVQLSADGGDTFSTLAAGQDNSGRYTWSIPSNIAVGVNYVVRVASESSLDVSDVSDSAFAIATLALEVTSPSTGAEFSPGAVVPITWSSNIGGSMKIELYDGGSLSYVVAATAADNGEFQWAVPGNQPLGAAYTIKLTSNTLPTATAVSGTFSILAPYVKISVPNGGDTYVVGNKLDITWDSNIGTTVNIDLFRGGVLYYSVATSAADTVFGENSYSWTIPLDINNGVALASDYRIRVYCDTPYASSYSAETFAISTDRHINVTYPVGGETLSKGSVCNITWDHSVIGGTVSILLSADGGTTWPTTIAAHAPNVGAYKWTVDAEDGTTYRVQVVYDQDSSIHGESLNNFAISVPRTITVSAPDASSKWAQHTDNTIAWSYLNLDNSSTVKIELLQNGSLVKEIASGVPIDAKKYVWNTNVDQAGLYVVKVTSEALGDVYGLSASFEISLMSITLVSPNGGEDWARGSTWSIQWTSNFGGNVRLELYKSGRWLTNIADSVANSGSYSWAISSTLSYDNDYTIRVVSLNDQLIYGESAAAFAINVPSVVITSPVGNEIWGIGSQHEIAWTSNVGGKVSIELYKGSALNATISAEVANTGNANTFLWRIPTTQASGSAYRVKITSLDNSTWTSTSPDSFSINNASYIILDAPNGGENWPVGGTKDITWDSNIGTSALDISYSLDTGKLVAIATVAANAGSYSWADIPAAAASDKVKITVASASDSAVQDSSDAFFTIGAPYIEMSSPVGGETWQSGMTYTVSWISNYGGSVKISLSSASGVETIATSTPNNGAYSWVIPRYQKIATDYKIKVESLDKPALSAVSGAFTVSSSPYIEITTPNGGEVWGQGSTQAVAWKANFTGAVDLVLVKNGVSTPIASGVANTGSYSWAIPATQALGSDYKITVQNAADPSVYAQSAANFTIATAQLVLSSPVGGEDWKLGSTHDITWASNLGNEVSVELLKGSVVVGVIADSAPNDGAYAWTLPMTMAVDSDYQVRLTELVTGTITTSPANFSLSLPTLSVTAPVAGLAIGVGGALDIAWTPVSATGTVRIDWAHGADTETIASGVTDSGTYEWSVDTGLSGDYRIVVTCEANALVSGQSGLFTVEDALLSISSPKGGEVWSTGSEHEIKWSSNLGGEVAVYLYDGDLLSSVISASTANSGSFLWSIPRTLVAGANYKVRINSLAAASVFSQSAAFSIAVVPFIEMVSPVGGEDWCRGVTRDITWTSNIGDKVKIEYGVGTTWTTIASPVENTGIYSWAIPASIPVGKDSYKIRVSSVDSSLVNGVTPGLFSISNPAINLEYPNGEENFAAGSNPTVTWTSNIGGTVTIKLIKGDSEVAVVASKASNSGSFEWNIPEDQAQGNDYKISITSDALPTLSDSSEDSFSIASASLVVTSPNGGETLVAGSLASILWQSNVGHYVKVDLYKGNSFYRSISAEVENTFGSNRFDWSIPSDIPSGDDYKIRLSSLSYQGVFDMSDASFTIDGLYLAVTYPNGGETLVAGGGATITWSSNAVSGNIKIELYKGDVPDTAHQVIAASAPNNGAFSWNLPSDLAPAANYRVRVSTLDDKIVAYSSGNFTVAAPHITVTAPAAGASWALGNAYEITWSTNLTGTASLHLVDSTWGTDSLISSSAALDKPYVWTLKPEFASPGSNYFIRVAKNDSDISPGVSGTFSIVGGAITVSSPKDGDTWYRATTQTIAWSSNQQGTVKIELLRGGEQDVVIATAATSSAVDSSTFEWTVPAGLEVGSDFKVRITGNSSASPVGVSGGLFTIKDREAFIDVVRPDGSRYLPIVGFKVGVNGWIQVEGDYAREFPVGAQFSIQGDDSVYTVAAVTYAENRSKITVTNTVPASVEGSSVHYVEQFAVNSHQSLEWLSNVAGTVSVELLNSFSIDSVNVADNSLSVDSGVAGQFVAGSTIQAVDPDGGNYFYTVVSASQVAATTVVLVVETPTSDVVGGKLLVAAVEKPALTITDVNTDSQRFTVLGDQRTIFGENAGFTVDSSTGNDGSYSLSGSPELAVSQYPVVGLVNKDSFQVDGSLVTRFPAGSSFTVVGSTGNDGSYVVEGVAVVGGVTQITVAGNIPSEVADGKINWVGTNLVVVQAIKSAIPNGVINWNGVIAAGVDNDGQYNWLVPPLASRGGDAYRVRVTSDSNTAVYGCSAADFTIKTLAAYIRVVSPNGGESWGRGSTRSIVWDSNAGGTVRIDLYKGGVARSTPISFSAPNIGKFVWAIDAGLPVGTDYAVSITVNEDTRLFANSAADFSIVESFITVTAPNGGEQWAIGSSFDILWNTNFLGNVKIDLYKYDALHSVYALNSNLAFSTPNDGLFTWAIPAGQLPGNDYKIRVTSVSDGLIYDESDSNFAIQSAYIAVRFPNGGERLSRGNTYELAWASNLAGTVDLFLANGSYVVAAVAAGQGGSFSVAGDQSGTFAVGKTFAVTGSVSNNGVYQVASAVFGGVVTVVTVASSQTVPSDSVSGQLRPVARIGLTAQSNSGSYSWTIPASQAVGTSYRVMVFASSQPSVWDMSENDFSIVPNLTLTAPNGGELWYKAIDNAITWSADFEGDISITLLKNGKFAQVISSGTDARTGSYDWTVPAATADGADYAVAIASTADPLINDQSASLFQIATAAITLDTPNGGEEWIVGKTYTVRWTSANKADTVDLYLMDGADSQRVAAAAPNTGAYAWKIASSTKAGSNYKMEVVAHQKLGGSPQVSDQSDDVFSLTVADYIDVTAPVAAAVCYAGQPAVIAWESNLGGNASVLLLKDGTLDTVIAESVAMADKTYNWSVPGTLAEYNNYTVQVTSIEQPAIAGVSDAFSVVYGSLAVTAPAADANWGTGRRYSVTWTSANLSGNAKVELWKNGASVQTISSSLDVALGTVNWVVPATTEASSGYSVVVTMLAAPKVQAQSGSFSIFTADYLTLSQPNSGSFPRGTAMAIKWESNLSADNKVNLILQEVGVDTGVDIAVGVLASAKGYTWDIPASTAPAADYKVHIVSAADSSVSDASDGLVAITAPSLQVSVNSLAQDVAWRNDAAAQSFTISLLGQGVGNFTVADNADWLSCSPASGSLTGGAAATTVTVNYSSSTLPSGTYTAVITVAVPESLETKATIAVTLRVFNPVPTGDLVFWYNGGSVTRKTVDLVTSWDDKSGNNNDASQTKNSAMPSLALEAINGQPALLFAGKQDLRLPDCYGVNKGGPFVGKTICVVFQSSVDNRKRQVIYSQGGKDRGINLYIEAQNLYFNAWNLKGTSVWGPAFVSTGIVAGQTYCATLVFDADNSALTGYLSTLVDGELVETPVGTAGQVGVLDDDKGVGVVGGVVGSSRFHDGKTGGGRFSGLIAEIAYNNKVVSTQERQDMEFNLVSVYNVQTTPIPVDGLSLWYDASFGVALSKGEVKQWYDRLGCALALKSAGSAAPTWVDGADSGVDAVDFGGAALLAANKVGVAGQMTALQGYVAFKTSADVHAAQTLWCQGDSKAGLTCYIEDGHLFMGAWNGSAGISPAFVLTNAGAIVPNTEYYAALTFDGKELKGYLNGALFGSAAVPGKLSLKGAAAGGVKQSSRSATGAQVKKGNYFNGDIFEVFFYDKELSSAAAAQVDAYLNAKYGVNAVE